MGGGGAVPRAVAHLLLVLSILAMVPAAADALPVAAPTPLPEEPLAEAPAPGPLVKTWTPCLAASVVTSLGPLPLDTGQRHIGIRGPCDQAQEAQLATDVGAQGADGTLDLVLRSSTIDPATPDQPQPGDVRLVRVAFRAAWEDACVSARVHVLVLTGEGGEVRERVNESYDEPLAPACAILASTQGVGPLSYADVATLALALAGDAAARAHAQAPALDELAALTSALGVPLEAVDVTVEPHRPEGAAPAMEGELLSESPEEGGARLEGDARVETPAGGATATGSAQGDLAELLGERPAAPAPSRARALRAAEMASERAWGDAHARGHAAAAPAEPAPSVRPSSTPPAPLPRGPSEPAGTGSAPTEPPQGPAPHGRAVAAGVAAGALLLGVAFALYQRIAKPAALRHEGRARLFEACRALPDGATAGVLARAAGMPRETAAYHLLYLARLGLLKEDVAHDAPRVYRVPGLRPPDAAASARAAAAPLDERILQQLAQHPGSTVSDLAARLGVTRPRVERRVMDFLVAGTLRAQLDGGRRRLYV